MMIQILIQIRVRLAQVNLKLLKMQGIIYVDGADNGTYQVVITPNSGSKVKGYLRVRQY